MSTHTPGPWRLTSLSGTTVLSNGRIVAETDMSAQGHADARLIAAAPDLLAACEAALEWIESEKAWPLGLREQMHAAIAKAKDGAA